jgi:hypothetical protein
VKCDSGLNAVVEFFSLWLCLAVGTPACGLWDSECVKQTNNPSKTSAYSCMQDGCAQASNACTQHEIDKCGLKHRTILTLRGHGGAAKGVGRVDVVTAHHRRNVSADASSMDCKSMEQRRRSMRASWDKNERP